MVFECLNLRCKNYFIENFYHWKFDKIKTKILGKLGVLLVLLENPWCMGFCGGDLVIFGPMV